MSKNLSVIDQFVISVIECPVPGKRGFDVATNKAVKKARKAYEARIIEAEVQRLLKRYAPKEA